MAKYLGIEFAKGLNVPFADFKNMFISTHIFKGFQPKEREIELKKAYKIACPDGEFSKPTKKGKSNKAKPSKEGFIQVHKED